ncbi:MAG: CapA family protein [Oscillospiraceae bacterium]|nr:CapA family protein [Oscillospiraceae bacterium]
MKAVLYIKRWIALLLIVAMLWTLASCASVVGDTANGNEESRPLSIESGETSVTIKDPAEEPPAPDDKESRRESNKSGRNAAPDKTSDSKNGKTDKLSGQKETAVSSEKENRNPANKTSGRAGKTFANENKQTGEASGSKETSASDRNVVQPPPEEPVGGTVAGTVPDGEHGQIGRVTEFKATAVDGGAVLTWNEVPGADGYCVFRLVDGEYKTYKFSERPGKSFSGLKNGTEYVFAVAAYVIEDGQEIYGVRSDDVTVIPENNTPKLSETFLVLKSGETHTISCLLYDQVQDVNWKSTDPSVASVDENGNIYAHSAGTAKISTEMGDEALSCTVCVDRTAPEPRVDTAARYVLGEDGVYRQTEPEKYAGQPATLMFTGDLMALKNQMRAARQEDGSFDFSASFSRVSPLLHEADLVIGNLETTLSESFPYSIDATKYMGISNCNTISSYLDALKTAGFDLLVTANNHYCDAGPTGVLETLDHLDEYHFMHIGTYRNAEESRVIVADVNGIRIGFLNYNQKSTNGKDSMFTEKQQQQMLGKFYRSKVSNDIKAARQLGAEFIVVCIHYGTQNSVTASETQESINQYLADCGADLIVGTHPHLLQKFSYVAASDGRLVPVAFSLGNFCSDMAELSLNTYNVILNVTLGRQGDDVVIVGLDYTPCCILSKTQEGQYIITPTSSRKGLTQEQREILSTAEETIERTMGTEIRKR